MAKVAVLAKLSHPLSSRALTSEPIPTADPSPSPHVEQDQAGVIDLTSGWQAPPSTYRPHTRWWWPGGDATPESLRWELDQMAQQGMGGVEIMSPWRMYTKGNHEYLSPEYLQLLKYAIEQAGRRKMEVSLTFGAGWSFGGFWVPPTQRSKVLTQSWEDVKGPSTYSRPLPLYVPPSSPGAPGSANPQVAYVSDAPDENQLVAVVAGRVVGDTLDAASLLDLTSQVQGNVLHWSVPQGTWRVMAFRLKYTGQLNSATDSTPHSQWVVDHFSKQAMTAYCDYLGNVFYQTFGDQFGETLATFFCDSFEISVIPGSIHWSNQALARFRDYKGYDLSPYLPAIWWNIGDLTPKVRYDVNDFLGWLALDTTFKTFTEWCARHNMEAKMQPYYRFTEELIQGAGAVQRPEMEVTTTHFAVVPDPRKAVAAGGHLYGRKIISAEAYTFLHQERYRTTLEQMKIASDAFLRDGVTQFYNHGYLHSPERHVAPSRDVPWANRISHWNTWWRYYHHLTAYIARCCFMLRQGEFAGDVLLYSPQATVWTQQVLFNNLRRIMPYGDVGQILVASGYDFDPVNDDVLQHRASVENGCITVSNLAYRFLILPATTAVPIPTLQTIRQFVSGGGIVIALDKLPSCSVGLQDHAASDLQAQQLVTELFGPDGHGKVHAGGGRTYFLPTYKIPTFEQTEKSFSPMADRPFSVQTERTPPQQQLLDILQQFLPPDFALQGNQLSQGLTFIHRRLGQQDIYFVTNMQQVASATTVTFRISAKTPEIWDPITGASRPAFTYRSHAKGVDIPIRLAPFESQFVVFSPESAQPHALDSNLHQITALDASQVKGVASSNGELWVHVQDGNRRLSSSIRVSDIPEPMELACPWSLHLEGYGFIPVQRQLQALTSWTDDPTTQHFSGTGRYLATFQAPQPYINPDLELTLDLGQVGDVAEVFLNGHPPVVAWMRPYTVDITDSIRPGTNHLEIHVTNTLINYVSGLQQLPPVPSHLRPQYGTTAPSYTLGAIVWERMEKGFHPLPPSGLLGPVRIIARRKVTMRLSKA
ncbi:MAG: glycosyl hydrolase [Acidobacteriaceae bacterium]